MKSSQRGVWVVIGIFVLGGAVLAGLFLAPRPPHVPPATTEPATVPTTIP
jgi:hypothetical protein